MATYKMQAPDGNSYQVEGPDGASDEQVRQEIVRQNPHLTNAAPPATPAGPLASAAKPAEPDKRSWFQKSISEPATKAVGTAFTYGPGLLLQNALSAATLGKSNDWLGGNAITPSPLTQRAGDVAAKLAVPQSGTEAGIMGGGLLAGGPLLGAVGKAVPAVAPVARLLGPAGATVAQKLIPPAARIAGATAGGAGGAAATGEDVGKGAMLGAASSIAGESMMTLAGKLVRSLPGAQTWIDSKMAKEVGQAIKDISAPLVGTKKSPLMAAKTAKDLQQLAVEGERKLGLAKGRIVQHIEGNTQPLTAPSLGSKPVTLSEANAQLTEMGKQAFGQSGTLADKQAYHKLSEEISAGLDKVDPTKAARQLWEGAQANYRKGLGLVDMLTPKPTFARSPGLDPVWWTPHGWGGKERPRCRRVIGRIRRSSGSGSLSWCVKGGPPTNWRSSSNPRPRRSGTG